MTPMTPVLVFCCHTSIQPKTWCLLIHSWIPWARRSRRARRKGPPCSGGPGTPAGVAPGSGRTSGQLEDPSEEAR